MSDLANDPRDDISQVSDALRSLAMLSSGTGDVATAADVSPILHALADQLEPAAVRIQAYKPS